MFTGRSSHLDGGAKGLADAKSGSGGPPSAINEIIVLYVSKFFQFLSAFLSFQWSVIIPYRTAPPPMTADTGGPRASELRAELDSSFFLPQSLPSQELWVADCAGRDLNLSETESSRLGSATRAVAGCLHHRGGSRKRSARGNYYGSTVNVLLYVVICQGSFG